MLILNPMTGQMADLIPASTTGGIFEAVEAGSAEFGVVPVENSNEGVVSHTLDLFVDSELTICAEIHVGVHYHLLTRDGELDRIESVYSHPQALAQCRSWLELNLPGVPQHTAHSTAELSNAVIPTKKAAAPYEL